MANKRTLMDFFGAKNDNREQQGDKSKQGEMEVKQHTTLL